MKKIFLSLSFVLLLGLVWVVAAQEASHDEADNTVLIARGREIFTTMGCTACHGTEAQGTDLAPALAGHSEFAVRRQLRAPVGIMPAYSPLMLTSEDIEAVVAYVTNLVPIEATAEATSESMAGMDMGGGTTEASHAHVHDGLAKGDISFAHHWLLYLALQAENKDAAIHQIAHILPLLEGGHLVQMENLLLLVTEGDFAAALPIVESMVVDVNVFGEDADLVYLQMIYRALLAEDATNSAHFMTDYLEHGVNQDYIHLVEAAHVFLAAGDFEGAAAVLAGEHGEHLLFEADAHEHGAEASHEHGTEATAEAGHDEHGAEATEEAHTGN